MKRSVLRFAHAAGNTLEETRVSHAYGRVTERSSYDLFKHRIAQVSAAGIAGEESTLRVVYDGLNRVVRTETGPFDHTDEAGAWVKSAAVETFAYDAHGNKTAHTDARGAPSAVRASLIMPPTARFFGERGGGWELHGPEAARFLVKCASSLQFSAQRKGKPAPEDECRRGQSRPARKVGR